MLNCEFFSCGCLNEIDSIPSVGAKFESFPCEHANIRKLQRIMKSVHLLHIYFVIKCHFKLKPPTTSQNNRFDLFCFFHFIFIDSIATKYVIVARKAWAFVQNISHRWARNGQNIIHQTVCASVFQPELSSHHRGWFRVEGVELGPKHNHSTAVSFSSAIAIVF